MIVSVQEILGRVDSSAWFSLGFGLVLTLLGASTLYAEVRAIRTGIPSPHTNSDEPVSMDMARRFMAWVAIVLCLIGGVFLLYSWAWEVYTCGIVRDPYVLC